MRIVHITTWGFDPEFPGGVEANLAAAQARMGHTVLGVCFRRDSIDATYTRMGAVGVYQLPYFIRARASRTPGNFAILSVARLAAFLRLLLGLDADVIHLHLASPASVAASVALKRWHESIPLIFAGYDPFIATGQKRLVMGIRELVEANIHGQPPQRAVEMYVRALPYRLADRVIAWTNYERRVLESSGVHAGKLRVVPNAVATSRFLGEEGRFRRVYGISGLMVLNVARYVPQKGQRYLLEAAHRIVKQMQCTFVFIGYEPVILDQLCRLASSLGVGSNVQFFVDLPAADVASALIDCDVFVLPSLAESFGVSILEAMACAKPIVATAVGGIPEVITEGQQGLLVNPMDPVGLAEKLLLLLRNQKLRSQMGMRGRTLVEQRYNWEAIARQVVQVYDELV